MKTNKDTFTIERGRDKIDELSNQKRKEERNKSINKIRDASVLMEEKTFEEKVKKLDLNNKIELETFK